MPTSFTLFIGWQVTFVCVVRGKHAEMYILHALHRFSERIECGGRRLGQLRTCRLLLNE